MSIQQIIIQDNFSNYSKLTYWRENTVYANAVRTVLSSIALVTSAASTHPFDTVKIRLQKEGELSNQKKYRNIINGLYMILKEESLRGIYKGLNMAIVRELSYGTIRTGLYEPYKELLQQNETLRQYENSSKLLAGLLSGTTGAILANPADVLKVRQQAHNRAYKGVLQECRYIFREFGIKGFWKGTLPNVLRGSIVTATQLGTYDITKRLNLEEGVQLFSVCAFVAGFTLTVCASPFDLIKTRIMSQNKNSKQNYNGVLDCIRKTYKNEGFFAFYKGFVPQWARFSILSTIYFITWESLRQAVGIKPI